MSEYDFDPTPATFDSLMEAVSATPRGRWFLEEFAKRNRAADTEQVLVEIARLGATRSGSAQDAWVLSLRREVENLHNIIDAARADVVTIQADERDGGGNAPRRLTELVAALDRSCLELRRDGGQMLDVVKRLRESDADHALSVKIEDMAANVIRRSSEHDLSRRRVKAVVEALEALDERLGALLARLGPVDDPAEAQAASGLGRKAANTPVRSWAGNIAGSGLTPREATVGVEASAESKIFRIVGDEGAAADIDLDVASSQEKLKALLR